jgi:hypothetical protein
MFLVRSVNAIAFSYLLISKKGGTMFKRKFLMTGGNKFPVFNAKWFGEAKPAKRSEQEPKLVCYGYIA